MLQQMEFAQGPVVSSLSGRGLGKLTIQNREAMTQHRAASSAPSAFMLTEEHLRVASVTI